MKKCPVSKSKTSALVFLFFLFGQTIHSEGAHNPKSNHKPSKNIVNPNGEAQCWVDGHGPYPEDLEDCIKMARDQARVNCATNLTADSISKLNSTGVSKARWKWRNSDSVKSGECSSRYDEKVKDCKDVGCASKP